jgi:hypothetical protein
VYRIVFAGGQFLAIRLRQIQQFVGIGLAGEKIRLASSGERRRGSSSTLLRKAVPDPQLRLRR